MLYLIIIFLCDVMAGACFGALILSIMQIGRDKTWEG
jgi:hypothetical protein